MRVAALLFLVALTACKTDKVAVPVRPDLENPERLICEDVPRKDGKAIRPKIPAEYQIDWNAVQTVQQARSEHEAYVASVRKREAIVSGYVVSTEGRLFVCSNNMQFWRDYWKGLPD